MDKSGLIKKEQDFLPLAVSEKQMQIRRGFWSKEELKKLIDLVVQNDPDQTKSDEKYDN